MDKAWLETCLAAGEFLYGEFPVTVLQKLYATRGEQISKEEIMEFYDESYMMLCDGEMFTPLIATEGEMLKQFKDLDAAGNPYASLHFDLGELQYLRKENQIVADQPYWIPTASQIEGLNAMMPMVNDFLNHVNVRIRKGWPPAELAKKMPRHQGMPTIMPGSASFAKTLRQAEPQLRAMGANVDYSSIDSFATVGQFGERRVVKVGRNDPCPCGSGKKYKHCHGR